MAIKFCGGKSRPDLLEGNYAGRQARTGVHENIAAVEGVRIVRAGAAIDSFIDLPQSLDAVALRDQGQQPVVRAHEVMAGAGLQYHREPLGADAGIHHRHEYRAAGPELLGLVQAVGAVENAGILVAQIRNEQVLGHAVGHAFHGRYGAILGTEIGEKHQGRRGHARGTSISPRGTSVHAAPRAKSAKPPASFCCVFERVGARGLGGRRHIGGGGAFCGGRCRCRRPTAQARPALTAVRVAFARRSRNR